MAMERKRGGHRLMSQINVVPYIDVMLVLLVIFMVAAPMINTSMVELPTVGRSNQPPVAPLEVILRLDGKLFLRDREHGGTEHGLTESELLAVIKEKQARAPGQPVVIAADRGVRYDKVVQLLDLLQQNQVQKVGLLTKPRSG